ncbi:MAG: ABC transporter permease [bacterium]
MSDREQYGTEQTEAGNDGRPAASGARPVPGRLKWILTRQETPIALGLLGLVLLITTFAPHFLSGGNIGSLTRQISFLAIMALGQLFVIVTAGIDLSVGSVAAFSGVTGGLTMVATGNPFIGVTVAIFTGMATGAFNGYLVAYGRVTPFIVTLGMMSVARGAVYVLTEGWPVTEIPRELIYLAQGRVFGVTVPVLILIGLAIACHIALRYTAFGRRVYAVGGNEEATVLTGINVRRIKLAVYMISNAMAAVVGVLLVARFSSAQSSAAETWELDSIAAAVIGGTSLMGGTGSVLGVVIGASIMGVIRNGLVLMRVSVYWQTLVIGAVIIVAAIIDSKRNRG